MSELILLQDFRKKKIKQLTKNSLHLTKNSVKTTFTQTNHMEIDFLKYFFRESDFPAHQWTVRKKEKFTATQFFSSNQFEERKIL